MRSFRPRLRFLHNKRQPRVARHTLPPSLASSAPQARRPAAGRDGRQRARARRKETDGIIRAARCRAGRLCPDAALPPASPPVRQPRRRRSATWSAIFRGGPTVSRPALNQHRPPCAGVQRPRSSFRSILGAQRCAEPAVSCCPLLCRAPQERARPAPWRGAAR